MTCAKRLVVAVLVNQAGDVIAVDTNRCANPQPVCPRNEGEGYEKCQSICLQNGHAEVLVITRAVNAGVSLDGVTLFLHGHCAPCSECQRLIDTHKISVVCVTPHANNGVLPTL